MSDHKYMPRKILIRIISLHRNLLLKQFQLPPRGLTRDTIYEAATRIDWCAVLVKLSKSKSDRTVLETVAFFRDTLIGKPAQNVQLAGTVMHWTPGMYAHLSDEEFAKLAELTRKALGPGQEIKQDGPQNQIESNSSIVEAGMASDAIPAR